MIGLITTPIQAQWTLLGQDIDGSVISDWYGSSTELSSDGNTVVVGATGTDFNGNNSGTIAVFNWNGSAWIQVGNNVNGEAANDQFGVSASISSDAGTIAGGAFGNDQNGVNSGHVRVFEWNGSSWTQKGLDIDGDSANDHAGWVISLSSDGSSVAIGIPDNDGNGADAGMARIYDWNGAAWVQKGLDIVGDFAGDRIGFSIDLSEDGNTVIVGARYNDQNGVDAGLVKIYSWNGSSWVLKGSPIVGEFAGDNCGSSVNLSANADTIAIGAIANDGLAPNAGHVRVFYWSGIAWVQLGNDIDGVLNSEWMGWSVSLSANGATIATGAMYQGGGGWSNDGLARIYSWNGSAWIQDGSDINSEGSTPDYSATCVSLSAAGDRVAIGAPGNTSTAPATGHVRIFYNYTCNSTYSFSTSECNSYTVPSGDEVYTALGTYTVMDTIPNSGGCDSLMTINLTINSSNDVSENITACGSYIWSANSTTYTATGSYTVTLVNAFGCDSIVTLDLTINPLPIISGGPDQLFCGQQMTILTGTGSGFVIVTWDNGVVDAAPFLTPLPIDTTQHIVTATSPQGCENTDTVLVIVYNLPTVDAGSDVDVCPLNLVSLCANSSGNVCSWDNGIVDCIPFTAISTTIYTVTCIDTNGCINSDDVVVSVGDTSSSSENIIACDSYIWPANSTTYTISGSYTATLTNASGCDSVATLNLTINTVDNTVNYNVIGGPPFSHILSANQIGANYQWVDCPGYIPIIGETSIDFNALSSGDHAVIIDYNGCIDTSACITIPNVGLIENDFGPGLLLYPNPTNGKFSLDLGNQYASVTISITDLSGKLISLKTYYDSQLLNLKLEESPGVYLLMIESGDKKAIIRLVKE